VWPRTAVIAERFWSPQSDRNVEDMYTRLGWIAHELRAQGIENGGVIQAMAERMLETTNTDPLMVLAAMVQPPLDYNRESVPGQAYNEIRPLNHMVDAVPAESENARHFANLAHAVASGTATSAQHVEIRAWLTLWARNDALLAPMLSRTALTIELEEVSRNLSRTATLGLAALDRIEGQTAIASTTSAEQKKELQMLEKLTPAALRNMAVGPVEELVAAAP